MSALEMENSFFEKRNAFAIANECVLMFSGGRDSTMAALNLHKAGVKPVLVTVTSNHLKGYGAVEARLAELKRILPPETIHLHVSQPNDLRVNQDFYHRTCLPCQHAYVVIAAAVAMSRGIGQIALGYAGYQADWPEQTPMATVALSKVVGEFGLELILPMYQAKSKDEVKVSLENYGLSAAALEQKCSRQVNNVALDDAHLREQIDGWEAAIRTSLVNIDEIDIQVRSARYLGSF